VELQVNGIEVALGAANFNELSVTNTSITNVSGSAIKQNTTSGLVTSQIANVRVNHTGVGLDVLAGNATIANSTFSHVANEAMKASNGTTLNAAGVVVTNSSVGLSAATTGSKVNFANCDILNNSTGLNIVVGATGNRFGNSRIFSNSVDENVLGSLNLQGNR
jgi:hypothetical protein